MVPVVKIGAIVAVVGVGLTGTYFMVFGADPMPKYELVGTTTSYNSKIGASYKHVLVDATKDKKAQNKGWWEWSYRRWKKDDKKNVSDEFKDADKVAQAFSEDDSNTKALNKVCDAAYKKADTDVDFGSGSENKYKLAADLLKYCSPLGSVPKKVSEDTSKKSYADSTIGKTKESDVASVTSPANHGFWGAMQKYFGAETNKPSDAFFKRISNTGEHTIKNLCIKSYDQPDNTSSTTATSPKFDDVKKYCSFQKITT